jgi:protein-S-isoprenylcysteine O-methyltransferase Ste14
MAEVNMQGLENKVPPILQVIVCAGNMWFVSPVLPTVDITHSLAWMLSLAIGGVGILVAGAGVLEFTRKKTTLDPLEPHKASALVVSGVYSLTRNPMYVGFALWLLALVIYLRSPLLVLGVVFFVMYMNRFQIASEERAMLSAFGEEWERYVSRVRRWL